MPFHWRLVTLLAILATVVAYEVLVQGKTVRLREYATLLACATVFGIYGTLNDVVTGTISPEYFVLGKGVVDDGHRFLRILGVGASAGVAGGFILGAVLLFARSWCGNRVSLPRLLAHAGVPLLAAVVGSVAFPLLFGRIDVFGLRNLEDTVLSETVRNRFILVWWTHVGIYAGAVVGAVTAICLVVRRSRADSAELPPRD